MAGKTVDTQYVKDVAIGFSGGMPIIDVRSDEEFKAGHIPGAAHISYIAAKSLGGDVAQTLADEMTKIGVFPPDEAILYCQSGEHAAEVRDLLHEKGFDHMYVYDGSWYEWAADPANPIEEYDNGIDVEG